MAEQNLRLRVVLDLVDRTLAPLKRIGEGSGEAAKSLQAARDQLQSLGATQKAIGDFRQARTGLTDLQAQLGAARDKARALALAHAQVGPPTQAMHEAFARARAEARAASAAVNSQQLRIQQLRDQLGAAGISTRNLAAHEPRLRADIAATTASITRQTDALQLRASHQRQVATVRAAQQAHTAARGQAREGLSQAAAVPAALSVPLKLAVDFESGMADVGQAVDFGGDSNGLARMSDAALDLSKRLPEAAKGIASLMAQGGQAGLSPSEILGAQGGAGFAEHAIKMGTAFRMTAEESGSAMARMKSSFGMSIPEVATLTDKIGLLGNARQVLGIVTRLGPLGAVAGSASGEIAALGATLAGVGVQDDAAAAGIRNLMQVLSAGEGATRRQREGFKAMGLDAVAVARNMQKDASGTMAGVFEQLGKLDKGQQAAALQTLFGADSAQAVAPLLGQIHTLTDNFQKVADSSRYAGTVEQQYAQRTNTTAHQLQLTKNHLEAVGITLGSVMLPALHATLATIMPWLDGLSGLIKAYPGVTQAVVMAVVALKLFQLGALGMAYLWNAIQGGLLAVRLALLAVRAGWLMHTGAMAAGTQAGRAAWAISKALTAAQWLWNAALAANPIALVILAIVALVAAGVMLYRNWDAVVAGGKALWADFTAWLSALWSGMVAGAIALWTDLGSRLSALWGALVTGAQAAWSGMVAGATALWTGLTGWLSALWGALVAGAQAAWGGLSAWLSALWSGMAGGAQAAWGSISAWLTTLWTSITGTASMAWQSLLAGVGMLWTSLTQTIMALGMQLPQQFAGLGSFLVDGLIGGITGKLGELHDAVVGAATSAAGWFKDKLGIKSPSRVFMQFGGWISEGAANGIEAGQAGVRAAALALAGVALLPVEAAQAGDLAQAPGTGPAAVAALEPLAPLPPLLPNAAAGGAGAPGAGASITINIQAAPGMDERALARLVAQELERIQQRSGFQRRSSLQDLD